MAQVHAQEVAGEEGRLLATGAGADLDDDVSLVVRVAGDELFLEEGNELRSSRPEPAELLLQVGIALLGEEGLGLFDIALDPLKVAEVGDGRLEAGALSSDVPQARGIGGDLGEPELCSQLVVTARHFGQLVARFRVHGSLMPATSPRPVPARRRAQRWQRRPERPWARAW